MRGELIVLAGDAEPERDLAGGLRHPGARTLQHVIGGVLSRPQIDRKRQNLEHAENAIHRFDRAGVVRRLPPTESERIEDLAEYELQSYLLQRDTAPPDLVEKRPDLLGREVVPRKSRLQVLLQCKLDGNTEASRYGDADLSQESRQRPVVPVKGLIESAGVLERRIQQNAHDLLLLVSKQQTQRIHLAAEMTVHGADQIRHVLAAEQLQDLAFH